MTIPDRARALRTNLDALLTHPLAGRFSFATPADAVAHASEKYVDSRRG